MTKNQAYSCLWIKTKHTHAYVQESSIWIKTKHTLAWFYFGNKTWFYLSRIKLMNQNQDYSWLCPRIKHTRAYESKPSILMSQNQVNLCLWIKTKHTHACVPETVSSYYFCAGSGFLVSFQWFGVVDVAGSVAQRWINGVTLLDWRLVLPCDIIWYHIS